MRIDVTHVTPLDNHKLSIRFSNSEERIFDVSPYMDKGIFTELKEEKYFMQVRVSMGTIQWPNGQDFCPDTLYLAGRSFDEQK